MNSFLPIPVISALAAASIALAPVPVAALPVAAPTAPSALHLAAADCYAVGQQVAAQNGGQMVKATPETRGGQTVCVVVVLVPARDGQRPRRAEFVVPAG